MSLLSLFGMIHINKTCRFMYNEINKEKLYRNEFARRSFKDIADEDYISARTLLRNDCRDQFLQLSQQTIEKYLKGILLFHDIKNKNAGHSIKSLMEKCEKEISHIKFDDKTKKIINDLDGAEHSRYLTYSFSARADYLLELDRAVLILRSLCQSDLDLVKRLSTLEFDKLRKIYSSLFFSGRLEDIVKNSKKYSKQYSNLIWKNFYLGKTKKKNIIFQQIFWSKNAPISDLGDIKHYNAVKDYIYLPKEFRIYFND